MRLVRNFIIDKLLSRTNLFVGNEQSSEDIVNDPVSARARIDPSLGDLEPCSRLECFFSWEVCEGRGD